MLATQRYLAATEVSNTCIRLENQFSAVGHATCDPFYGLIHADHSNELDSGVREDVPSRIGSDANPSDSNRVVSSKTQLISSATRSFREIELRAASISPTG